MENADIFYGHLWKIIGKFHGHMVNIFMAIWYIFPVLVSCTKKNLATLLQGSGRSKC
jgi:hypothetical protein